MRTEKEKRKKNKKRSQAVSMIQKIIMEHQELIEGYKEDMLIYRVEKQVLHVPLQEKMGSIKPMIQMICSIQDHCLDSINRHINNQISEHSVIQELWKIVSQKKKMQFSTQMKLGNLAKIASLFLIGVLILLMKFKIPRARFPSFSRAIQDI